MRSRFRSPNATRIACLLVLWVAAGLAVWAQGPRAATNVRVTGSLTAPTITSLSPSTGAVGASVVITGTTFSTVQGTSTVTFNGTTATPTAWSNTSITVTVPTGATTGPVIVTVAGQASNSQTFTVSTGGGSTLCSTGTVRFVRAGATGTATGLDWTNALTAVPASPVRGVTYCVAGGSYSALNLGVAASGTTTIVIAKATVADHGTSTGWSDTFASTTTFASLNITTKFIDIHDVTFTEGFSFANGVPGNVTFINMYNVTAKYGFIVAQDILLSGGSYGGYDPCDGTRPEDIMQIWDDGVSQSSSRVTFDGVTIHDNTDHGNTCSGFPASGIHVDCLQMLGGHNVTIRHSQFYNCATSDIIGESFRDTLDNLTVENNFFQQVQNPGASINFSTKTLSGTNVVQYNTITGQFIPPGTIAGGGSFTIRGNILTQGGGCGATGTYTFNVFSGGGGTCGSNAITGNPSYVGPTPAPSYLNGIVPNYRLAAGDTVAADRCSTTFPTTDIDSGTRPFNGTADCGADERGVP